MSELPWYPLYPGDYGRDTGHLSMIEDGAYRRLLDHYYSTSTPLPKDKEAIYRICRALQPCERKAVNTVVEQFFELREDGYHNRRADLELARRSLAGKRRDVPTAAGGTEISHATGQPTAIQVPGREAENQLKVPETPRQSTENHFSTGASPPQSHPQSYKEKDNYRTPSRASFFSNRTKQERQLQAEINAGKGPQLPPGVHVKAGYQPKRERVGE